MPSYVKSVVVYGEVPKGPVTGQQLVVRFRKRGEEAGAAGSAGRDSGPPSARLLGPCRWLPWHHSCP